MKIIIFIALVCALALGTCLLMPNVRNRIFVSRAILASAHGSLGALGLAGYFWWLAHAPQLIPPIAQTAVGLTTLGLVLGVVTFVVTRHKRKPPDLILTAHVIFAGMGALVIMGLILI